VTEVNPRQELWEERAGMYDFSFEERQEDAQFYMRLAKEYGSPVLEGGCATGRILLPMAREGITVHGVDFSEAMLERFRQKLESEPDDVRRRTHLYKADLLEPVPIDDSFSLIFLAFGTLGTFIHDGEAERVLRNLSPKLAPHGRLVIERRNRLSDNYCTCRRFDWARYWPERRAAVTQSQTSVILDESRHIREQAFYYDVVDESGNVTKAIHRIYFREFTLLDMQCMLERAGLRVEKVYGDYRSNPFDPGMPRVIVVAERA